MTQHHEEPGERLRAARQAAGLSAKELGIRAARLLGRPKPISESAVRNQENGTNGIPKHVAAAYAKVLNVPLMELLFGFADRDSMPPPPGPRTISFSAQVSGLWRPAVGSDATKDLISLELPGYHGVRLMGATVSDHSLEPHYERGDKLILAKIRDVGLHDGDHIYAAWKLDLITQEAIKAVIRGPDYIDLAPIGQTEPPLRIPLSPNHDRSKGVLAYVVVGRLTVRTPKSAALIPLDQIPYWQNAKEYVAEIERAAFGNTPPTATDG